MPPVNMAAPPPTHFRSPPGSHFRRPPRRAVLLLPLLACLALLSAHVVQVRAMGSKSESKSGSKSSGSKSSRSRSRESAEDPSDPNYVFYTNKKERDEAHRDCKQKGHDGLAVVDSLEKLNAVMDHDDNPNKDSWIGLKVIGEDVNGDLTYRWISGASYTDFPEVDEGGSKSRDVDNLCVLLRKNRDELKAEKCNREKAYICQVKYAVAPTTETPTTEPVTSPEPTTQPVTSPEPTTQPVTSPEPTTQPVTSPEPTTQPVTSPEPTTQPVTSPEPTTEAVTSPKPTTEAVTSPEPTTKAVTSPQPTTEAVTSPQPTTEAVTSPQPTTEQTTESPGPLYYSTSFFAVVWENRRPAGNMDSLARANGIVRSQLECVSLCNVDKLCEFIAFAERDRKCWRFTSDIASAPLVSAGAEEMVIRKKTIIRYV